MLAPAKHHPSIAIGAAFYSLGKKLYVDKQLRLSRSGGVSHRNAT